MDKKQTADKIDKLIKEYKDAQSKAKYDDLSDLHNDALVENLETRALRIIELTTEKNSVFQKQAYYEEGRSKRINELIGILEAVKEELLDGATTLASDNRIQEKTNSYIDNSRILELKSISVKDFDLSKLIKILDELNICYKKNCYLAVITLTRALIDHVPPIFKCKNFTEVTSNYQGSKSFKDSMEHLEKSSRKIADQYLHCQIRKSESLPNKTQINFSNDIDVLLGEIVRILKF